MLGVRRGHIGENLIVAPARREAPRPEDGEHDPGKDYGKGAEGGLRPNFHSESVVRITLPLNCERSLKGAAARVAVLCAPSCQAPSRELRGRRAVTLCRDGDPNENDEELQAAHGRTFATQGVGRTPPFNCRRPFQKAR